MQCPLCQSENPENSRFCSTCGNTMEVAASRSSEELAAPALPPTNIKVSTKTKGILAAIVIVLISIFAYQFFTKPLTPDQVAAKFMDALQKGNWSKAYAYLDDSSFIGRDYLSEECFKAAFANKKVSEYKLDTQASGKAPKTSFHYIFNAGGERNEGNLILANHPVKGKDNWKIDPDVFIVTSEIRTLPDVTVKVNGKVVKCENGSAGLPMFEDYSFPVEFEHPDITALKVDAKAGQDIDGSKLEINPALQETIKAQITGYFEARSQTGKDNNISHFTKFVKADSSLWNSLEYWSEGLAEGQETVESKINEIKITKMRFDYDLKTIAVDLQVSEESAVKDKDGTVLQQNSNQQFQYNFTCAKQDDGSWLLTDD